MQEERENLSEKNGKTKIILVVLIPCVIFVIEVVTVVFLFAWPVDFSQNYREIGGVEGIVFNRNGTQQYYKRTFYGLTPIDQPLEFEKYERQSECMPEIETLQSYISCENEIHQAVISPDGKYILYSEIEYGYMQSGMTDDEYVRYRVYDIENDKIITIYKGYREFYNLGWQ